MRTIIKIGAFGAAAIWTLLCWLAYALGDGIEDMISASAGVFGGDPLFGLVDLSLNALQGLGGVIVIAIWLIGMIVLAIPTMIGLSLFRRRERRLVESWGSGEGWGPPGGPRWREPEPMPQADYSRRHSGKGKLVSDALDAARKYR
jgi:hypothetical protein